MTRDAEMARVANMAEGLGVRVLTIAAPSHAYISPWDTGLDYERKVIYWPLAEPDRLDPPRLLHELAHALALVAPDEVDEFAWMRHFERASARLLDLSTWVEWWNWTLGPTPGQILPGLHRFVVSPTTEWGDPDILAATSEAARRPRGDDRG